ncbi:HAD family hydrolase [Pseudovibrio sp. Tun.PSC04-5.I4]|uniref:HAD family hydrolase n=1 Tax=Pseudovibrio sp. Tun.PSC04-5.I4 TaxID=1798213 RepID=UPI0008865CC0|nr:HAD family hydrolase [Pseudovibrio sp. Tun.PSC04-5.I4]SDQ80427.1 haloacid dehalogenase superfamily, subfamily IA, variant 3 with third motif having DD or ED [Pseudovibrio sp. Tun.PSC04-5.I4]
MSYELLIWDCDGCLIDSEQIGCRVEAEAFTKAGYTISTEEMIRRFIGISASEVFSQIEAEMGHDIRNHEALLIQDASLRQAFENELLPITGVHDALTELDNQFPQMQMCIASSSSMERLDYTLRLTGLHNRFENKYFSGETVPKGKPAPDVFLKAAEEMGVAPARCLVIEDSPHGLKGAHAAGMDAIGFTGASHGGEKLHDLLATQTPLEIFNDMKGLPSLVGELTRTKAVAVRA